MRCRRDSLASSASRAWRSMYPSAGSGEGRPVTWLLIPDGRLPRPAPPREILVDDHLADVGFRAVQLADLLPLPVDPDQHLLHQVLGQVWVPSQGCGKAEHGLQPGASELVEGHRGSALRGHLINAAPAPRVCSPAAETAGGRSRPVLARKPSMRPGRYCIRLSRVFTSAVSWSRLCLVRLARDLFRCDQTAFDRVELGCVRRELVDRQPVPGGDQRRIARLTCVFRLSQTRTIGPPSCWCAASSRRA